MKRYGMATGLTKVTEIDSGRQDVEVEKEKRNFVRAAHLAAQAGYDLQELRHLQCAAVRQFIEEFRNFEGAARLISEYGISCDEFQQITSEVLTNSEAQVRTFCYHRGKPASLSLAERVQEFAAHYFQC